MVIALMVKPVSTSDRPCRGSGGYSPASHQGGPGLATGSVHVGFVVGKVAFGKVSLKVLRFSPVNIVTPYSYMIWGINNRPVSGRSSEIVSPHRHE
jgi:hypothetical protein